MLIGIENTINCWSLVVSIKLLKKYDSAVLIEEEAERISLRTMSIRWLEKLNLKKKKKKEKRSAPVDRVKN